MKHKFKTILLLFLAFTMLYSCQTEEIIVEETKTSQSGGFELVPFEKVLESLKNPNIKSNLAALKQRALASRGDEFADLQLFENSNTGIIHTTHCL